MVRLIKRYGSRKLYDTEESRYVSLDQIGRWIQEGQEIQVVDNKTQEDVTAQTLTQVILDNGKRGSRFPSSDMLHQIIRQGSSVVTTGVDQLNQGVDRLLKAGMDRLPPIRHIRDETALLRSRLEELEASLDKLDGAPLPTDGPTSDAADAAAPSTPSSAFDAVEADAEKAS